MIEPTTESLKIFSQEASRFQDIQSILGICFQTNVLIDRLSIREHFFLFGVIRGLSNHEIEHYLQFFSNNLELHEVNSRAFDLSGGQKRKLCIALSLLGHPPLIIMDEPTAGVDIESRQIILKAISSLKDTTTIITLYAIEEAELVSSQVFIVAGGKLIF
jgi:ABC-type multidrug transport system ATPase subunit